jgi:hypothetical protein
MVKRKKEGRLTYEEERIVKALLNKGDRNQDIQALINVGRNATINSARISGVKEDDGIDEASPDEVDAFMMRKEAYDWQTGLNLYDDERLIRAREAMILAVHVFNNPSCRFKTEIFAVLANIAWTYLLHEFYLRKRVEIVGQDGRSFLLSQMLARSDCPLSQGMKHNLAAIKTIRDEVEHLLLRGSDFKWISLFQASCLNFESTMVAWFGPKLSLRKELSFALQFAKLDMDQIAALQRHEVPEEIEALDARLREDLSEADLADLEYQFRVIYTLDNASKSQAAFQFIAPGTQVGGELKNVLVKHKLADDEYPYKPTTVAKLVSQKCKEKFTPSHHAQAWALYKVRPKKGAKQPENTNKEYCIYHSAHSDYTYSAKWVDFLVAKIGSEEEFARIKAVKL